MIERPGPFPGDTGDAVEPMAPDADAGGSDDAAPDTRSFAERFRGTAWGEPGQVGVEADVVAPPVRRSRRPRTLAWIGAVLVVGSIAGIAVLALGGSRGTLAGPAPADTLVRTAPDTPAPGAAVAAIDRFLAVIADPRLAYEARTRSSVDFGGAVLETRFSARVSGSAVDVRYVLDRPGQPTTEAHVITIGSRTWVQGSGTTWRKVRSRPADLPELDVFDGLTGPAQLGFVGPEMRRGNRTEHLRTVAWWVSPMTTRLLAGYPDPVVELSRLDIWVLPDGRPVEVVATLRSAISTPVGLVAVSGQASYVFARVGETAAVKAPK